MSKTKYNKYWKLSNTLEELENHKRNTWWISNLSDKDRERLSRNTDHYQIEKGDDKYPFIWYRMDEYGKRLNMYPSSSKREALAMVRTDRRELGLSTDIPIFGLNKWIRDYKD